MAAEVRISSFGLSQVVRTMVLSPSGTAQLFHVRNRHSATRRKHFCNFLSTTFLNLHKCRCNFSSSLQLNPNPDGYKKVRNNANVKIIMDPEFFADPDLASVK
jgi:hypothetical protein